MQLEAKILVSPRANSTFGAAITKAARLRIVVIPENCILVVVDGCFAKESLNVCKVRRCGVRE